MNITITPAQFRKAADIQERIQSLQSELDQILGGKTSTPAETDAVEAPKRRKVSAAGRVRMRAAQIARWAKIKGTAPATSTEPAKKPKQKMSAQGLANIRAGVAKRMAARAKALKKSKF
ncbi:MAG: hypothetical protein NT154_04465 [Verrucomicrobia bacterium]|nr:hypothetical protein [Verrucomicrobiota bacterium]